MKIYLGADHRGFSLKEKIKNLLSKDKFLVNDLGAFSYDPNDDYPIFAEKVAKSVSNDLKINKSSKGILFCGSGVGVDIVANKIKRIRSGLAVSKDQIKKAREDDDINILTIPAGFINEGEVEKIVQVFLKTPFSKEKRKIKRLEEIKSIENEK